MINQMHTRHQDLRHRWKHSSSHPLQGSLSQGSRKDERTFQSGQIVLTKNPLALCRDQTVMVKCALLSDPTPQ